MLCWASGFSDSVATSLFSGKTLIKPPWVHLFSSPYFWVTHQGYTCFCSVEWVVVGGVDIGYHCPLFSGDMLGGIQLLLLSPFLVPCLRGKKRCCSLLASHHPPAALVALVIWNPDRSFWARTWAYTSGVGAGRA